MKRTIGQQDEGINREANEHSAKEEKALARGRLKIPYDTQVRVFFRDKWLCWLCGRPAVFAPAFKHLDRFVRDNGHDRPTAYFSNTWRRDTSPLLLEMAAVMDHAKSLDEDGPSAEANLRTAHHRCNMWKSDGSRESFQARHPNPPVRDKHSDSEHWDGFVSLFMVLARKYWSQLTPTDKAWYRSVEKYLAGEMKPDSYRRSSKPSTPRTADDRNRPHRLLKKP